MTNPAVLRLSSPYRPEAEAAAAGLRGIDSAVDWPAVAAMATPWLEAARREPAPFWAVETLLREYPISSAEGNALMRLAEALLRVPDRETAIALTADQLGRADVRRAFGRIGSPRCPPARSLCPRRCCRAAASHAGLMGRLGGEAVVAIALRAVQLLGRQFVLGERIDAAMARADEWRAHYPAAALQLRHARRRRAHR